MRFLKLDLLAFGPFTNVSLSLERGDFGLHLVYGPNEAGKSSALRALTQLLYGIPDERTSEGRRHKDNFLHSSANLRIGAALRSESGEILECIRRKGRSSALRGSDDVEIIDPVRVAEMLGGIDETTFRERFGIDSDELRRGGQAIVGGEGVLGEILFAAGSGLADVKPLQDELSEKAGELFKPKGQNQRINRGIAELLAVRKQIKEQQLSSTDWLEQDKLLRETTSRKEGIDGQLLERRTALNRLERIERAIPLIAERSRLETEWPAVANAPVLPSEFSSRRIEAVAQLAAARRIEQDLRTAIEEAESAIKDIDVSAALLEHRSTIVKLHTDLGAYRKAAQDRPALVANQARLENEARGILRELDRPDDLQQSETLRLSRAQRQHIQSLSSDCRGRLAEYDAAKKEVRSRRQDVEHIEKRLSEAGPPINTAALEQALQQAQQQGDLDQRFSAARVELEQLQQRATVDLQKLPLWSSGLDELEKLSIPGFETIDRLDERLSQSFAQVQSLAQQRDNLKRVLHASERDLEQLRLERDVPSEEELLAARNVRDEGLRLIALACRGSRERGDSAAFVERFAPTGDLPEAFEACLRAADQIADRLRREADRVAKKAQLAALHQESERNLAQIEALLDTATAESERLAKEWQSHWEPLAIEPLSPREMRSWVDRHARLCGLAEAIRKQQAVLSQLETIVSAHRGELIQRLSEVGEPGLSATASLRSVVLHAVDVLSRLEQANAERKALQRDVEKSRRELHEAESRAGEAQSAVEEWRRDWALAVERLGLDREAAPSEAIALLETIDELFAKRAESDKLRERIDGIDRESAVFTQSVTQLLQVTAPDMAGLPVERGVDDVYDRLNAALKMQTRQDELRKHVERQQNQLRETAVAIATLTASLDSMCREAGCESADDLPAAEQRSDRRQQLENEFRRLNKELAALAGRATVEELINDAGASDADDLKPRIQRLRDEIGELDEAKSRASETIGSARARLADMETCGGAAESQERAEHLVAQIRSDTEEYVRLRLGTAMLKGAIERYCDKNQSAVLQLASDIFAELTSGSFDGLRADYNDSSKPILVAVRSGGRQAVSVAGLSEGTESQLYLALRMAVLERDLAKREAVPFIVDDILKDFDDDRAVAALKALARLSARTQVIVFTHHNHLVELARESLDDDVLFTHRLDHRATSDIPARTLS